MADNPLRTSYAGLAINFAAFVDVEELDSFMLWIADREGLLKYCLTTTDGYFLVVTRGKPRVLRPDEVLGFVLALFDTAGLDIESVAYRTGLTARRVAAPAFDGAAGD